MRRYKPEIITSCERNWGEWIDHHDAAMVESRYGEWTRWRNAHDAIQMLTKRAARLEARIARLEDELFLQGANIPI